MVGTLAEIKARLPAGELIVLLNDRMRERRSL